MHLRRLALALDDHFGLRAYASAEDSPGRAAGALEAQLQLARREHGEHLVDSQSSPPFARAARIGAQANRIDLQREQRFLRLGRHVRSVAVRHGLVGTRAVRAPHRAQPPMPVVILTNNSPVRGSRPVMLWMAKLPWWPPAARSGTASTSALMTVSITLGSGGL